MNVINKIEIKKILVIRFKGLGDILLSVPALRALKKSYPQAHVAVLVNKEAEAVVTGLKFIDEIILFEKNRHKGLMGILRLIAEIRKRHFDLVVDLISYPKSALLTYSSGAKYRVGTAARGRSYAYNIKVAGPKGIIYGPKVHLLAVKEAGAESSDETLEFHIPESEQAEIDKYLENNGIKNDEAIGLNPFTSFETRNWGIKNFAELADRLTETGKKVILLWGPGEPVEEFRRTVKGKVFIAPPTDIKRMAALLTRLKIVITTNTFLKHAATAVNTPVLTIYGATNPLAWEQEKAAGSGFVFAGVDCQPCEKNACTDLKCLKKITVQNVLDKLTEISK